MKVVIAPDSFKGSLSAAEVAAAIARGWSRADDEATIVEVPLADGGEGTVQALVDARGGSFVDVAVTGPLGDPVNARCGLLDDTTAVIELAAASGLHLSGATSDDSRRATTYGTGELIVDVLDRGATEILLAIGGSATTDGGTGLASALGVRFLDAYGSPLDPGGAALAELATIDVSGRDPRLDHCDIRVACDVDNPLTGGRGAAAVFGPQKGATAADVADLDAALAQLAAVAAASGCPGDPETPGAGAAGGVGFGVVAFAGAGLQPGIELVIDATRLDVALADADLLITGEGRLDGQTMGGKTIAGVLRTAARHGVPTVAIVGGLADGADGADAALAAGLVAAFPLVPGPITLDAAIADAAVHLERTAHHVARLWTTARSTR